MRMQNTECDRQQSSSCEHEQFPATEFIGTPSSPVSLKGCGMGVTLDQLIEDVYSGHIEKGSSREEHCNASDWKLHYIHHL